jgi:TonB family protein
MSNTPQGAEPLAIADRRLWVRRSIPSLAYIDLGESNGGVILNISEGGLAVTLVAPLSTDVLAGMRFQLPGSSDWLEAGGKIARISGSKQEAGLRFVDLSEDARNRIKNWVSSVESAHPWPTETSGASPEKAQPAVSRPTRAGRPATAPLAGRPEVAHDQAQGSIAIPEIDRPGEEALPSSRVRRTEPLAPGHLAEALDSPQRPNRRAHVRRLLPSLAYIDLGENNGGVILNISEGGLAVTLVGPADTDALAHMRFQLPGLSDCLEAGGTIARISESKKEAGLRFVGLSEETRNRIKGWISSEASSAEWQREEAEDREKIWRRLEMPIAGVPQGTALPPASFDRITRKDTLGPRLTPNAESLFFSAEPWPVPSAPTDLSRGALARTDDRPGVEARKRTSRVALWWRAWATTAVVAFLGAFLVGWLTSEPGRMNRILARFGTTRTAENETASGSIPASSEASPPSPTIENALPPGDTPEPVSSTTAVPLASRPAGDARTTARSSERAPASSSTNVASSSAQAVRPQEPVLESGRASGPASVVSPATDNAPPQNLGIAAARAQEPSAPTPSSANVSPPDVARAGGATEPEGSPASKPAVNPEALKPSISVSLGLFPSIRVPAGFKSQTSPQGAPLRVGQLLSRVDPVYPAAAQTQHIEGTVKLHAVIGPDGTIESVETRSGPTVLMSAAKDAVQQWRYTPSSIGGQPVEAEEDITITFRLQK